MQDQQNHRCIDYKYANSNEATMNYVLYISVEVPVEQPSIFYLNPQCRETARQKCMEMKMKVSVAVL